MKVIAMYLPQFHRVKENDAWWGDGFTEWTTVKGADRLFEDHDQPRIPMNDNYYNLLDKNTLQWQASLMKKYSVDGVCMYHYWFKDGRQILEKPAQNLLQWKNVDMPFCFCWANETWARSWSFLSGKNTWADDYEQKDDDTSDGILLEQRYGNKEQWKKHFEYLFPFFQDERYIRMEDKPLFLIYKTNDFPCLEEMLEYWQMLARSHGLKGLYVIGGTSGVKTKGMEAEISFQPAWSRTHMPKTYIYMRNGVSVTEYDDIWNAILGETVSGKNYFEGIVGYDDTPRRGTKGCVTVHASPEKFSYYLTELLAKSAASGNEICFLNAWNEWGEGMYLEPDEKYGERYLEAIPYAKKNYLYRVEKYKERDSTEQKQDLGLKREQNGRTDKNVYYLRLMDQWMTLKERGVSIVDRMVNAGYKKVAIYGYGMLGRHLLQEMHNSKVAAEYIIDMQKEKLHTDLKTYLPCDDLPEVDAVIVSATYYYDEIYRNLKKKGISKVISLETILYEEEL